MFMKEPYSHDRNRDYSDICCWYINPTYRGSGSQGDLSLDTQRHSIKKKDSCSSVSYINEWGQKGTWCEGIGSKIDFLSTTRESLFIDLQGNVQKEHLLSRFLRISRKMQLNYLE